MEGEDKPSSTKSATRQELPEPRWARKTLGTRGGIDDPEATAFDPTPDGRYTIAEELGRGGMGRVVAATDTALGRGVAIKQALSDRVEDLTRFEREVRITARLEHPSIVPIYDVGRDPQGQPYYVMRRLEGEPLSDVVSRAKTPRDRLALVTNVLAAVDAAAFAHARKIIHRDIKPWNILVGAYGETLLIDWGLARDVDDAADHPAETDSATPAPKLADSIPLTRAGEAYGTPGYMAPEQARGDRVDERADVYALGATLFHVLAGATLYDGTSATEWISCASKGVEPPLERIDPEVPRELVAIVGKAMANEIADRYRDAGELAADLRAFLAGQLVAAHHYTAFERVRRFVRRHRVAVSIGAIAIVALAITAVLAIDNIVRERDRADVARLEAEAGERRAADLAAIQLLDRASTLANHDPTRALVLLRRLPAGSHHARRARDIAAVASAGGIAHGRATHAGSVQAIAMAPDGRWLASGGSDGTLQIHDLASNASRTVYKGDHVENIEWIDGGAAIAFSAGYQGLHVFDVATSRVRTLDASAFVYGLWTPGRDDRVRYYDRKRRAVLERTTRGGPETTIASNIAFVVPEGEVMLVGEQGTLRVLRDGSDRTLVTHSKLTSNLQVALAPDQTRAAAILGAEVVEWDLGTARELQRWPVTNAALVFYSALGLHALQFVPNAMIVRLTVDGVGPVSIGKWSMLWTARSSRGTVFVTNEGGLSVITPTGQRSLVFERSGVRRIASHPKSSIVAIGTGDGTIMWWDLRDVLPAELPLPSDGTLCALDATAAYFQSGTDLLAIPRDGKPHHTLATFDQHVCNPIEIGPYLAARRMDGHLLLVDRRTGETTPLATDELGTIDTHADTLVFIREGELFERVAFAPVPIKHGPVPKDGLAVATSKDWIAIFRPGEILRIERATGARSVLAGAKQYQFAQIGEDGTPWFTDDKRIYRAERASAVMVVELATNVTSLQRLPDYGVSVGTRDAALWAITRDGIAMRAAPAAGDRRPWTGYRVAVTRESAQAFATRYLDTGETITRSTPVSIMMLVGSKDERSLALHLGRRLEIFEDPVPADPALLGAWIDKATNAVLGPTSDVLTWR